MHQTYELDTEPRAVLPNLRGVKVLVVDDETDARELIRRVLEGQGAAVTVVSSGEEAIAALERVQTQHRNGPCLEAMRIGEPVAYSTVQDRAAQWPHYVHKAGELGLVAVAAVPLRNGNQLGVLDLYDRQRRDWAREHRGDQWRRAVGMPSVCQPSRRRWGEDNHSGHRFSRDATRSDDAAKERRFDSPDVRKPGRLLAQQAQPLLGYSQLPGAVACSSDRRGVCHAVPRRHRLSSVRVVPGTWRRTSTRSRRLATRRA